MSSGGLGTACYGLTKGLSNHSIDVTFVMPYAPEDAHSDHVNLISTNNMKRVKVIGVKSILKAYISSSSYSARLKKYSRHAKHKKLYGEDLFQEVERFAHHAELISQEEDFDVIHCHDWMTFPAGMMAKHVTGKPLVVHVHATEFDRTGGNSIHQHVYDIERAGMHAADRIIAVSNFTKAKIVNHYGVHPDKVTVVHNAIDIPENYGEPFKLGKKDKVVLFLGRITLQKGPDYFIYAAKKCLEFDPNLRFILAGTGDMEGRMIEKAAEMGIGDKVLFAGFISDERLDEMYRLADVYVMPSVSEPFGITPLEAIKNGTPAIISRQSGVSEILTHCLKVDFWDINQLVDRILAVLKYEELHHTLKHHGSMEIRRFNWNEPAKKCIEVYNAVRR